MIVVGALLERARRVALSASLYQGKATGRVFCAVSTRGCVSRRKLSSGKIVQ